VQVDPSSGRQFYANTATGQTQWEPPEPSAADQQNRSAEEAARRKAAEEAARRKAAEEEAARRKAAEEAARRKAAEEEAARKEQQRQAEEAKQAAEQVCRNNARTFAWIRLGTARLDFPASQEAKRKRSEEAAQRSAVTNAPSLPAGWVVQVDPSSGRQFYANTATGQTQWEPPGPSVQAADQQNRSAEEAARRKAAEEEAARKEQQRQAEEAARRKVAEEQQARQEAVRLEQQRKAADREKEQLTKEVERCQVSYVL
jgi:hypothetical protein